MVEPILLPILEGLAPGHGVAAPLVGAVDSIRIRFVSVVNGGRADEQELEQRRAPEIRIGDLGIGMEPAGIVAVKKVKLVLPQSKGQLCQVLHNPVLQILRCHV